MKEELIEVINTARRELRLASGLPLTPEEQAEETRNQEMEELLRVSVRIRLKLLSLIEESSLWTDKGAAVEFQLEGHVFHLRKQGKGVYGLFEINGPAEREVVTVSAKDSQFDNRMLVAMADRVLPSQ